MESFKYYLNKTGEIGEVQTVTESTATVSGLPGVTSSELVIFDNNHFGEVLYIHEDWIEVLFLSDNKITVGAKVARTGEELTIPVGPELLGCIIDPLGNKISGSSNLPKTGMARKTLNGGSPGIEKRATVSRSLETGVAIVDALVPLGKGQRELVIGDRKTGKTGFIQQIVAHQAKEGTICIFSVIGRQQSEIKEIHSYFEKLGVMKNIIIVAASAEDPAGLIYLSPYSACAIAEHFRDQNIDTVVILDDMTTHAKFYREICLLAKRFPGRDSYPVDIFFAHAKMLEKGGNFVMGDKETSISILPVIQTSGGDLSGYIQTNMMSMTDGHIYFDADLYSSGRRPAVNPFLSVTRVGRQAQTSLKREINREVLAFLSNYEKLQSFVHFGAELTEEVRISLAKGEKFYRFFEQNPNVSISSNVSVYIISLIWLDYWHNLNLDQTKEEMDKVLDKYNTQSNYREKIDEVVEESGSFSELLEKIRNE